MPTYLPSGRTRCSPGQKKVKGTDPTVCVGTIKKKSPTSPSKRRCKYGINSKSKTKRCLSKKELASRMRSASKKHAASKIIKALKARKDRPWTGPQIDEI